MLSPFLFFKVVLDVEMQELGIAAGLQDRVIQVIRGVYTVC